jgi:two-component system sensor histidine kinase BaeS
MGCRFAALFLGVVLFAAVVGTLGVWLAAAALGIGNTPAPVRAVAVFVLLLAVFGVMAGGRGMRRLTRPVADLVEAASRIERGDYTARVAERGPREARSVARAFNAMTARLELTQAQRRSFLADVAHELRTPLSIIRGQAEGIADGIYPGDPAHLAPIIDATQTLDRLVEDLRTLALSEAGSLELAREPVEIAALVHESLASFQAPAEAKGVDLREQVQEGIPAVDADPVRIRGVLVNLLANAVAHTPAGGRVSVRADRTGDSVEIAVTDTGAGIPEELLPRIFDRFVKGPASRGTGLGLAIARDLVRAHGGTISAESRPGSGTTVRFTLPLEARSASAQ